MSAKRIVFCGVLFLVCGSLAVKSEKCISHMDGLVDLKCNPQRKEGMDPKLQSILANVVNIFQSFVGVVQNPDNASDHVTGMVTGAVQLIAEAVRAGDLSLDASEEEIREYAEMITRHMQPELKKMAMSLED